MKIEKTVKFIDKIIYPNDLYNLLKDYKKLSSNIVIKFGDDCVRIVALYDDDEKRLDKSTNIFREYLKYLFNKAETLLVDEDDLRLTINQIIKQIENGIPEKNFYEWFTYLSFQLSQMNLPLDENSSKIKKGYLPCSIVISHKYEDIYVNYIFFSSNGSLLTEENIQTFIKKVHNSSNKIEKKITKRDPIGTPLRHECFKRDNYRCVECGRTNKESILHADHILPVSQNGKDELDNLQTLCDNCNFLKSDKHY